MDYTARTALLLGSEAMERLHRSFVVQIGIGGVGGSCAEALARSGVGRLHLIDGDSVEASNLNRQLFAAKSTVGLPKVTAAIQRLEDVSACKVTGEQRRISPHNAELPACDFIIDAIDDVPAKLALILWAKEHNTPILSCMGAGRRRDPSSFSVVDIYKTADCPLARKLRHELRILGIDRLPVVFSSEKAAPGQGPIGSFAPAVNAAGLTAAAYVIEQLIQP